VIEPVTSLEVGNRCDDDRQECGGGSHRHGQPMTSGLAFGNRGPASQPWPGQLGLHIIGPGLQQHRDPALQLLVSQHFPTSDGPDPEWPDPE
jgi:hypothetical protein